jgi:hypothetical protein
VAPILPPRAVRHLLRRIRVTIILHDYILIAQPGSNFYMRQELSSVDALMQYCRGARSLRNLTNSATGFSNLDVLDLEIIPDFRSGNPMATLALMKAAAFAVSARKVNITVQQAPQVNPGHMQVPGLKSVIAVTLLK